MNEIVFEKPFPKSMARCVVCDYDLSTLVVDVCPECGYQCRVITEAFAKVTANRLVTGVKSALPLSASRTLAVTICPYEFGFRGQVRVDDPELCGLDFDFGKNTEATWAAAEYHHHNLRVGVLQTDGDDAMRDGLSRGIAREDLYVDRVLSGILAEYLVDAAEQWATGEVGLNVYERNGKTIRIEPAWSAAPPRELPFGLSKFFRKKHSVRLPSQEWMEERQRQRNLDSDQI